MSSSPALEVRGLGFSAGGRSILRDIDLTVEAGESLSIIGPNGAGKSTLLKCLDRIVAATAGNATIFGRPLASLSQRELGRLVSYVPQADARPLHCTAGEFVLMGRYPHGSPFAGVSATDRQRARAAMQLTGTEAFARRPIGTLSGGERQKVFIAAALAQEAGMLFLDEPTTFLDYYHRRAVLDLLDALRRDGITLLTVTHDLDQALARSDRVLALRGGEPVFLGTPQDLLDGGHLEEIFATRFLVLEHPVNGRPVVVPDGERR